MRRLLIAALLLAPACAEQPCDCPTQGVTLRFTAAAAAAITSIVPSGAGCAGAQVTCQVDAGACRSYLVMPAATGECQIAVHYTDGSTYRLGLHIQRLETGCCQGLFADPIGAAIVEIPGPGGR